MQIAREEGEEVQGALLLSGASLHAYLLLPTPASISCLFSLVTFGFPRHYDSQIVFWAHVLKGSLPDGTQRNAVLSARTCSCLLMLTVFFS